MIKRAAQQILRIPERLCAHWATHQNVREQERRIHQLQSILEQTATPSSTTSKTIVIGLVRLDRFFPTFAMTLSRFFAQKGYRTRVLIDDGQMGHWDMWRAGAQRDDQLVRFRQQAATLHLGDVARIHPPPAMRGWIEKHLGRWASNQSACEYVFYSDILSRRPLDPAEHAWRLGQARQGHFSDVFLSSHRRFHGGRDLDLENQDHLEYGALSIKNEMISETVAHEIFQTPSTHLYITLDGIYTTFGVLRNKASDQKIPNLIFQPNGFTSRHLYIGEKPYALSDVTPHWEQFASHPLPDELAQHTRDFLNKRSAPPDPERNRDYAHIAKIIKQKKTRFKRVIALFPNLTWDGAVVERDTLFSGLGDWMKKTVEWAGQNNALVVIREHPQAPTVHNQHESALALLEEWVPSLRLLEHVLPIDGTQQVNSYQLVREWIDCPVVYNGTLGVEIPFMPFPVVIASGSPYNGKGVGFEPCNRDDYFNLLATVTPNAPLYLERRESMRDHALKAAAYQFFFNSYYCPLMPTLATFQPSVRGHDRYWSPWDLSRDSLDPGRNAGWKRTIDRFLESAR